LAAWYFLASTNGLVGLLDVVAPLTKAVGGAEFPCAHHECACGTANDCATRCCCFEGSASPAHGETDGKAHAHPAEVHVSRVIASKCAGGIPVPGVGGGSHALDQHVPSPGPRVALVDPRDEAARTPLDAGLPLEGHRSLLEKVPLPVS